MHFVFKVLFLFSFSDSLSNISFFILLLNIEKTPEYQLSGIPACLFLDYFSLIWQDVYKRQCKWCANPESQLSQVQILYDREKCAHCGTCTHVCPNHAISMGDDGYVNVDPSKCKMCIRDSSKSSDLFIKVIKDLIS